ncbi:MAG: NAD(+)/NADH kinase [Phycisphaerae bacterium]|jgi:NAD+ kinase
MSRKRVVIVRNPAKHEAQATLASLEECFARHAEVTATGVIADAPGLLAGEPDRVVVLGGDGSILAVARGLGPREVPVVGVNFGKLGYLAEFGLEDVNRHVEAILHDDALISRRMMIHAAIRGPAGTVMDSPAVNDCVVHAGPPFRMIELSIRVDEEEITTVAGDGLVLSTPTGSTAHNMSAGGPIVQSEVSAIVLTPLTPHSLTHRPVVVAGSSTISVLAREVNAGTTVAIDGQLSAPLRTGDELHIRRHVRDFLLVHNPSRTAWHTLTTKLRWGR